MTWTFHEPPAARYRHYRLNDQTHTPEGLEILSVTQALGVLDKSGPLQGYAARETLNGIRRALWRLGSPHDLARITEYTLDIDGTARSTGLANVLYREKLTYRDKTSDAQDRGTAVHWSLEDWIDHGHLPNPAGRQGPEGWIAYPPHWAGYFRALAGYLARERPEFLESELIVGSATYGFAGKRDTVARVRDRKRGIALLDAKTSKSCYPESHFRQLSGYNGGGIECGEEPTDSQGILRLGPDGSWDIQWVQDMPRLNSIDDWYAMFLRALAACRDNRAIKDDEKCLEARARVRAGERPRHIGWCAECSAWRESAA